MIDDPSPPIEPLRPEDLPRAYQRGTSLEGVLPIVAYVAGDQIGTRLFSDNAGVRLAIIMMTLAAGWAGVQRHRRAQAIGWWIPAVAVYLLARGIAGLIWGETVFLATGIGLKVALGLVALGSVLIGRPLAGELAPLVMPFRPEVRTHPRYVSTMRNVTLAYSVYQLVTVGFEIWLLGATESGSGFLVIRTLVGTVGGFVGFLAAIAYADRALRNIPGFIGVLPMFEQIGLALEADRLARRTEG